MKIMYKLLISIFLALTLVMSGCIQEETDQGETTEAEMSFTAVYISDAPSDNFSYINVTISQVKVHKSGNENDSGWITFDIDPKTIDMIHLHENNLSEKLGVKNLSVGTYSKLWIVVDSATGILKDTLEEIIFDVPSGDLKIQQAFDITQGNTTIDVELDLDRSILYVPQGGVYKLLPQLGKMTINNEDDTEDDDEEEEEDEDEEIEFIANAGDEYEGEVNETIEFEGEAENGVEPYNWSWDFGDGNTSIEQNPEHTYNTTGAYTATLTVTDDNGNIAIDTASVIIEEDEE